MCASARALSAPAMPAAGWRRVGRRRRARACALVGRGAGGLRGWLWRGCVLGSWRAGGGVSGWCLPPSGSRRTRRQAIRRKRFRKPFESSIWLVWRRSSAAVMWPMTEMCAFVARAGAVRVRSARGGRPRRSAGLGRAWRCLCWWPSALRRTRARSPAAGGLGAGVLAGGVADRPDQALPAGEAGQDRALARVGSARADQAARRDPRMIPCVLGRSHRQARRNSLG